MSLWHLIRTFKGAYGRTQNTHNSIVPKTLAARKRCFFEQVVGLTYCQHRERTQLMPPLQIFCYNFLHIAVSIHSFRYRLRYSFGKHINILSRRSGDWPTTCTAIKEQRPKVVRVHSNFAYIQICIRMSVISKFIFMCMHLCRYSRNSTLEFDTRRFAPIC